MNNDLPDLPIARPYQDELLQTVKEKNSLVCLGTGAGKTYIAVMLISHRSHELEPPYDEGGKRTFFLVPTRPLVKQQAAEIVKKSRFSENDVGEYTGDMNVDFWSKEVWLEHLRAKKIFVMTRQIFLNMLNSAVLPLNKVNLLIFDEAHHAAPKMKKNVTNDCYKMIMDFIHLKPQSEHPHILGLSASLINANSNNFQLKRTIADLESTYKSRCISVTDLEEVRKYATDPIESIYEYHDRTIDFECNMVKKLLELAVQIFYEMDKYKTALKNQSRQKIKVDENLSEEKNRTSSSHIVELPISFDAFKKSFEVTDLILESMGPWCALKACDFYIQEFQNYIQLYENPYPAFSNILTVVNDMMKTIAGLIKYNFHLQNVSFEDMLLRCSSDKMKRLLQLLMEYRDPGKNLSGIVFVKRRAICKALCKWVQKVKEINAEFHFVKTDYIVGEAGRPGFANKIAVKAAQAQRETLNKFRMGDLNLLFTTSILEEGLDVSQCNLVVRYDGVDSYREWVQSQGRARSKDGRFVVFSGHLSALETKQNLSKFKDLANELQTIATTANRTYHHSNPSSGTQMIPEDEMPLINSKDGARVTLDTAKTIVLMYCSRLPSDAFFSVNPNETMNEDSVGVHFSIRLPINSPIKGEIGGPVKQSESKANKAAYLNVCRILREHDEIDERFVPYNKKSRLGKIIEEFNFTCSIQDDDDEVMLNYGPKPGTVKRRQIYSKSLENMFAILPIKSSTSNCLYSIDVEPRNGANSVGFICSQNVSLSNVVESFLVYIKTAEFKISVTTVCTDFILSSHQLYRVQLFHQIVFHESLGFKRKQLTFDDTSPVYVVPLDNKFDVDWGMIQLTLDRNDTNIRQNDDDGKPFNFNESDYKDAMVYRRYNPIGLFEVLNVDTKTPNSKFPDNDHGYKTYTDYFDDKYGLTIIHSTLPLLNVDSIGFNSSIKRVEPTKAERKRKPINLVPEFLLIFPIPTSFHRQCRLLPAIFYRLCQMYNIEQLRQRIASEANFGWKPLPSDHRWGALNFGCDKVDRLEYSDADIDPHSCDNSDQSLIAVEDSNETEMDVKSTVVDQQLDLEIVPPTPMVEDIESRTTPDICGDIDELIKEYSNFDVQVYADSKKKKLFQHYDELLQAPQFFYDEGDHSQYLSENSNVRIRTEVDFNRVKSFDYHSAEDDNIGPTPSLLLQALTTSNAIDMFNMERLETLGDSFLKLTTSAYFYYKLPMLNEGYLSSLKVSQISNRNLYDLGSKKNLADYMVAHQFQPSNNWLPPGFSADIDIGSMEKREKNDEPTYNKFTQQKISDKSVADCCEALIGAYLLSSGPKGAVTFMTWLGIKIMDPDMTEWTKKNGHWLQSPTSAQSTSSSIDSEMKIKSLYSTLTDFEKYIDYNFRDKCFLIQAMTHISYHDNTVTDCYQRLEFLGDAVLDYLITRYIYEDPKQFTPGDLTDLRAALTNNAFFGSLAVKHKFHNHLKMNSFELYRSIYSFADKNKINANDVVYGNFMTLIDEREAQTLDEIDIPKALGDVFESVAGAIYLDSNYSLDAVWRVYYPLMKAELEEFSKNIPKSPLSLLHIEYPKSVVFSKAAKNKTQVSVSVTVECKGGTFTVEGVGKNRYWAKNSAAKRALKRKT